MQTLFADETGAATGQAVSTLNMQLNSFAILPKVRPPPGSARASKELFFVRLLLLTRLLVL